MHERFAGMIVSYTLDFVIVDRMVMREGNKVPPNFQRYQVMNWNQGQWRTHKTLAAALRDLGAREQQRLIAA